MSIIVKKSVKIYVPITDDPKGFSMKDLPPDMKPSDLEWGRFGPMLYPCRVAYGTEEEKAAIEGFYDNAFRKDRREKRCLLPDGRGGFIRCPESNSCSRCQKKDEFDFTTNRPLSLDQMVCGDSEEAFDIPDVDLSIEAVVDVIVLNSLLEYLADVEPVYADIFRRLCDRDTVSAISRELNIARSTVDDMVKRIRKLAIEFLKITK